MTETLDTAAGRARVLLVEDEEVVRDVVAAMLEQSGFDVVAVDHAGHALDLCKGGTSFDLLLTDLVMPSMNGVELAAAVQAHLPRTRVIYMSGYSADHVDVSTPRIQKPFTRAQLVETISTCLAA
jgi:two-component system, cell cycle sensor histidine kinase and response regulator CckA